MVLTCSHWEGGVHLIPWERAGHFQAVTAPPVNISSAGFGRKQNHNIALQEFLADANLLPILTYFNTADLKIQNYWLDITSRLFNCNEFLLYLLSILIATRVPVNLNDSCSNHYSFLTEFLAPIRGTSFGITERALLSEAPHISILACFPAKPSSMGQNTPTNSWLTDQV